MIDKKIFDRKYRWSLISYCSEEEIMRICQESQHFAYIRHYKENVEPHWHILLTFKQQISLNKIRTIIGGNQNTFGQPLRDNSRAYRYLTREDMKDEDKEKYDRSDIVTDSIEFWSTSHDVKTLNNEEFIYDLMTFSKAEMAIKYGRDYIRNYERYEYFKMLLTADNSTIESIADDVDF